ncbi:helix-turn-helix transcriptional regulator [Brucella tritici]|uniref:Helix-turn-helix transcriptional regulator n=1 Tax=Brucella tritici TaxID=94626 RepID=A0A7V7VVX7_9HYPH|nr:helix-turn-helix transcriptional regulator [Brucella tritici]
MGFHPNMKSRIADVRLLDDLRYRVWDGAIADVWSVYCGPQAQGEYISQAPRLFLVLENLGELAIQQEPSPSSRTLPVERQSLCYIPAGMLISSRVMRPGKLKHLDLHLDMSVLQRRFGGALDRKIVEQPRLFFSNSKIEQIGALLAEECQSQTPLHDLYGEGLLNALIAELFQSSHEQRPRNSQLSQWQLRRVTEFIEDNYSRVIRLHELASLADLSESYFCSAFKASTGISPHAWQMQKRIERAQALLMQRRVSLPHVAAVTGFSDQAHFTRVFKKLAGITPAAWMRQQRQ